MRKLRIPAGVLSLFFTVTAVAQDFSHLQWAISNTGEPQIVDIDPLQTLKVPARSGEDIQRPPMVKAAKKVLVAVLDTGIQKNHPDLKNVIRRNESECKALAKFKECVSNQDRASCEKKWMDLSNPEVDQDKNGYPLDCQGWSLLGGVNQAGIMGRPDFDDDQGHGTHVAGIIAAEVQNRLGIQGASNNVEILPVQVIGVQPSEPLKPLSIDSQFEQGKENQRRSLGDIVARGVIYAMRSGAQVINFSMGWPQSSDSELMRKVIAEAQSRGIIIVAAAGNDSTKALLRPCAYPNVICVGATGPDGGSAHFSNFGSGVDIFAPGVNILSTYPEKKRPVRFRSTLGYEFLSGTSQAAPYVTAAVAELLARGVPAKDVHARLMLGSRDLKANLDLLKGGSHERPVPLSPESLIYKKYGSAGQLSLKSALDVKAQPLVVMASKEKAEISWDRQNKNLHFEFALVNRWAEVSSDQVKLQASFEKAHAEMVRPAIKGIQEVAPYAKIWKQGEERKFVAHLEITDHSDPSKSRIPSELELSVFVKTQGQADRRIVYEADVTVPVTPDLRGSDVEQMEIRNLPKGRISFIPVDQVLDAKTSQRDYLAYLDQGNQWQVWIVRQTQDSVYEAFGGTRIRIEGNSDNFLDKVTARMDLDQDGQSEYVLGILEDRSEDRKASPTSFYIFDENMRLKDQFVYNSELSEMPLDAGHIYWQSIGKTKRPVWMGGGKDPTKKDSLKDLWENPDRREARKLRLYFLNADNKLQSLETFNGYHIADIIQPSTSQNQTGTVSLLLAKNKGTAAKPSFLYDFAVAELRQGSIQNFRQLDDFQGEETYRNILDTRVDAIHNLRLGNDPYAGSFWFGEGQQRQQRMTLYTPSTGDLMDRALRAERSQFDSALRVRAAFLGDKRGGAFVLTNSEIQFHDFYSSKVVSTSMNRYSFFPDNLFVSLYLPLSVMDSTNSKARLPSIFTTENSGLSRGVRMLVPVFAKDGTPVELVSPARLRFKSTSCRSMETPVFLGSKGAYALDYYCGDRLLRVHLTY